MKLTVSAHQIVSKDTPNFDLPQFPDTPKITRQCLNYPCTQVPIIDPETVIISLVFLPNWILF